MQRTISQISWLDVEVNYLKVMKKKQTLLKVFFHNYTHIHCIIYLFHCELDAILKDYQIKTKIIDSLWSTF